MKSKEEILEGYESIRVMTDADYYEDLWPQGCIEQAMEEYHNQFTPQPKAETWKQKLADHTCHHKFEDMNTSEMEVAEFVAGTISNEGIKDESMEEMAKAEAVKRYPTNSMSNQIHKMNMEEDKKIFINGYKAGYAANQTKNNKL